MERVNHPGFVGTVNLERRFLSDDPDTAVAETVALMAEYARADSESTTIRRIAEQLRGKDDADTIGRVWSWIRARVRFVPDRQVAEPISTSPTVAEVLIRPVDMVRMRDAQGDCDDFSMLGAALFRALGIPAVFVTVAADPAVPDQYSHVYLLVAGRGFDSSHGGFVGWECPNKFDKKTLWSVETGMPLTASAGLGGLGLSEPSMWADLLKQITGTGLQIVTSRYGVPPEGTVIQTADGSVSRATYPAGFDLRLTPPAAATAVPGWVWLAVGAGALFMLAGRGRR